MTAGATGYPWRRFVTVAVLAAVSWSGYSTLIGLGAGAAVGANPLAAAAIGVVTGVLLGLLADAVLRRVEARREGTPDPVPATAGSDGAS